MSFVNRTIQAQDRALYQLDQAESSKPIGVLLPELSWTVDDSRQIYLRGMGSTARGAEPQQNPTSVGHSFHFHVNGKTYLLSLTNDLTQRRSNTSNQHWELSEHWVLEGIDPGDQFTNSSAFLSILKEVMAASLGGKAYIALRLAKDGAMADYQIDIEVAQGVLDW